MSQETILPLPKWEEDKLLGQRASRSVIRTALANALDVMILGYVEQANRIIHCLHEHNGLQFENDFSLQHGIFFAWAATGLCPDYVRKPEPSTPTIVRRFRGTPEDETDEGRLARWEKNLRDQWPQKLGNTWPDVTREHLGKAIEEAEKPESRLLDKMKAASAAADIAMALDDRETAEGIVRTYMAPAYHELAGSSEDKPSSQKTEARQKIAEGRLVWKILADGFMGAELGVDGESVENYVATGVALLGKRLSNGPARPYASKSISDLLQILDESYVAARRANPESGVNMSIPDFDASNVPSTFLKPGATAAEIAQVESLAHSAGLPSSLPADYKLFLQHSNGFYPAADPADATGIFYGAAEVETGGQINECNVSAHLLPYEYTSFEHTDAFSWPDARAVSIGAGGDEGYVWLVAPESVKAALGEFERVYGAAPEKDKRVYERAALDLYGGIDEMRRLEWLVITWYHWNPDPDPFRGFRAYLEHAVQYAVDQRKEDEAVAAES